MAKPLTLAAVKRLVAAGESETLSSSARLANYAKGWNERLQLVLSNFSEAQVLPFDAAAAAVFDDMRSRKVRVGAMDLRIASIALSHGMTVLSRNLADFGRVPGLRVEDWTIP